MKRKPGQKQPDETIVLVNAGVPFGDGTYVWLTTQWSAEDFAVATKAVLENGTAPRPRR